MRKAISPVIATVILIAITIMIGAAVGSWLLSLWGNFAETESFKVYPGAKLEITNNEGTKAHVKVTVKNDGTRDVRVVKLYVEGVGECTSQMFSLDKPKVIKAGKAEKLECEVNADANRQFIEGASYDVKVVTERGNVYSITVVARGQGGQHSVSVTDTSPSPSPSP